MFQYATHVSLMNKDTYRILTKNEFHVEKVKYLFSHSELISDN